MRSNSYQLDIEFDKLEMYIDKTTKTTKKLSKELLLKLNKGIKMTY